RELSWTVLTAVIVIIVILGILMVVVMPKFKALQKLTDRLNLVSREGLSGMMVIRAFGNEQHEAERFREANEDLTFTTRFVMRSMALMGPVMALIMSGLQLAIVWFGAKLINLQELQLGEMMAFLQYAQHILISFLFVSAIFIMVPRAQVSAQRVAEVLDTEISIKDKEGAEDFDNVRGEVVFDHVSFRYPDAEEDVITDVSFTAKPGETTAFIGSTGSGKSTLINLVPRFYDVTAGSIKIDGRDIRDVKLHDLREAIGYVPQKAVLFSGTIESNVKYGNDSDDISEAIEVAQAAEFVYEREEGIEAPISQGATNVSGGQKQRLSIARALAKKPPIYVFDDSFSALDFKTDAALRAALKKYTGASTVLIVAQRVSTIMNAQQIIVLDEGKVAGKGTHRELLETCPYYRAICESQLSKEELA
ncbi:MAG: ABC transporter ATP-binding protein, partial [Clostridia bacterium]|nr:ABC transporter ATP-binding protein [Clostridia bacterium]